jgi:hypothetical protein
MTITTRSLLDLRPGSKLTVTLRSGRVINAELRSRPTIATVGKPGIHRVRLEVADIAAIASLSDGAGMFARLKHYHEVPGHNVVSVA